MNSTSKQMNSFYFYKRKYNQVSVDTNQQIETTFNSILDEFFFLLLQWNQE